MLVINIIKLKHNAMHRVHEDENLICIFYNHTFYDVLSTSSYNTL